MKTDLEQLIKQRIYFSNHKNKEVLFIDYTGCDASQVTAICRKVPDYVTVRPRGSVLILTNFAGASFNEDTMRTIKETAVFDKPFVKKSALIGTESLPRHFYEDMKKFSRRELPIFVNREEALSWLIAEK